MGRTVNVVLPSGRVVAVDEDIAKAGRLSEDTGGQLAAQEAKRLNEERTSGVVEGGKAALEGAADTLSFGGYGALRQSIDPEGARDSAIRAQERSGMRFLGESAAMALPGLGEAGLLGRTGGAVAHATAPGIARGVGHLAEDVGGAIAGHVAEGGILGVGGYISQTNVTGDPLTIESAVESAGIGALMDVGMNVAANKLSNLATRVRGGNLKAAWQAEELEAVKRGKQIFSDPPPSWNEFVESHAAAKEAVQTFNKDVAREATKYEDFWGDNRKLTKAIDSAQDAVDQVRHNVYKNRGGPFGGTPERVKYNLDQTGAAKNVEYTYESGKVNVGFEGETRNTIKGPAGEEIPVQGEPQVRRMQYDVDKRPEISDRTLEKLKDYNARISRAYQMKAGGWKMDGAKWVRDASAPANPMGALEELRAIKNDLMRDYPKASGAVAELPNPPRTPMPEISGELPKSLDDFARKHAPQINEIAQGLDPASADALGRVMKDLDVTPGASPTESLTALHETLRDYRGRIQEFSAEAERAAAKEASKPALLRWLNKAGRYAAGRVVDTGGALGAVKRSLGGELMGRGMSAAEGAALGYAVDGKKGAEAGALGAVLLNGRLTLRDRVRNLIGKYGVPTASLAGKLAPVTAYLSTAFPSGERDPEGDVGRLAVNRMGDIQRAAMVAPDAAYLALQGALGQPGDVAFKMHQHVVGTLNYLVGTLPRDPGLDTMMFHSNWTPQYNDAIALAHRLEAVNDPLTAVARAIAGDSHPAATEALWAVYPAIMNELAQEISVAAPELKNLTYEQASAYSNLFRTPLTGLQQPATVMNIQGLYMRGPQSAMPGNSNPGAKPAKAVGRPPAVQSSVAGSNVSSLIR